MLQSSKFPTIFPYTYNRLSRSISEIFGKNYRYRYGELRLWLRVKPRTQRACARQQETSITIPFETSLCLRKVIN